MASSAATQGQIFVGPGLSPFKRAVTILGVLGLIALVLWIAIYQGISVIGSTIAALLLITGFVFYLRIIAPIPFTIELEEKALPKKNREKNGSDAASPTAISLAWASSTLLTKRRFCEKYARWLPSGAAASTLNVAPAGAATSSVSRSPTSFRTSPPERSV